MKHCEHLLLPGSATKQAPSRQSSTKLVDSSKHRARVMICKTNVVVFFLILFMTIISQVAAFQSGIHRALTLGGQSLRSSTTSSNLVRSLQEKKQQEALRKEEEINYEHDQPSEFEIIIECFPRNMFFLGR